MAQNECQQMDKTDFYSGLRNAVATIYSTHQKMVRVSEFLNTMDAATATNMGIDNTTRDVVADLRTAINEALAFYDGTATSRTQVLKTNINKLRHIS